MADEQDALSGGQGEAAPAATETPALSVDGEQGAAGHWADSFPEEYRDAVKGFETPDAFKAALKPAELPESYAIPEGMEVDQATFDAFAPMAKELGLSQAAVEKLLAFDAERMKAMPAQVDAAHKAELTAWAKEIGADKYTAAITNARKALQTFASPEDVTWLQQAGLANSPRLVKILANIGVNLQEETPAGGEKSGKTLSEEERIARLYPKM